VAQAAVTISSDATQNISCSNGVCVPTADDAVLNAGDLENLLASGDVSVTTTGAGGVEAGNIVVQAAFSWSDASALTLEAYDSIAVNKAVSVTGTGALAVTTNNGGSGGTLSFGSHGHVSFADLSSELSINGVSYTLEGSVKSLAAAIKANPAGDYALAANYDASHDHTYARAPIATALTGTVEGLGNVISHLAVTDTVDDDEVGLFADVAAGSAVNDLGLEHVAIEEQGRGESITAGLAALADGNLTGDWVSGTVAGAGHSETGGLAGRNTGAITRCHVTATVSGMGRASVGGLVSTAGGTISQSFATGDVHAGAGGIAGGLAAGGGGMAR
jgi:hypothetical protein